MSKACTSSFFAEQALLWNDHVWRTTKFLVAGVNGLEELVVDTASLFANQKAIGDNFAVYFGAQKGQRLTELLNQHILIAAAIVDAATKGDKDKVAELQLVWTANGKEIANFYHDNLKHTSLSVLEQMWQAHLDSTTEELVTLIDMDFEANAAAIDVVLKHMSMWSQYIADHICSTVRHCKCHH